MSKLWRAASGGLRAAVLNSASRLAQGQTSLYHTIQAIPRECAGKKVAARERAQGRIPAVVLSPGTVEKSPSSGRSPSRKYLLTTEKKQIQAILNSVELPFLCSTTFPLQIRAGSGSSTLLESGTVLPIKIHMDKETGKILNLVFVWADEGSPLKVDVPVVFKGEDACPGLKKGGHLKKIRDGLKFVGPPEHIPSKIEVDVSSLDIEDWVSMHEVKVHPSLKLLSKNDTMPICKITAAQFENGELARS